MTKIASHKTRSASRILTGFAAAAAMACVTFFAVSGTAEAHSRHNHHRHHHAVAIKQFRGAAAHIGFRQRGEASYYYNKYHPGVMGAAHKWLPKGTHVKVTNLANDRQACVVINDRGPYVRGRIIDVEMPAVGPLGLRSAGHAPVEIEVVASCGSSRMQRLAHFDIGS